MRRLRPVLHAQNRGRNSGNVYLTRLACKLLDVGSCRCSDYPNRKAQVPDCVVMNADTLFRAIILATCELCLQKARRGPRPRMVAPARIGRPRNCTSGRHLCEQLGAVLKKAYGAIARVGFIIGQARADPPHFPFASAQNHLQDLLRVAGT